MSTIGTKGDVPVWLRPPALSALVLALTVLRLFTAAQAHLVEDEAYYRLWGLYPAWGYYDHPPMVAWWIWIGQQIAGDTTLGVRLIGILATALGSAFLWRTACLLFDRTTAGWAVLFLNASILVGVGGILSTPDAPSVFFWGLSLWALAELIASRNPNWWLMVGLCAGLGLTSKYSVLFLGTGIVLWLLWVPDNRRWFFSWQLWAGGLLALLCFMPVLLWNHAYEWASFYKQFGRAGAGTWTGKYIFEFLGALIGLVNPLIAIAAGFGAVFLAQRATRKDAAASLLILTLLPFLAYLLYHSLQARVQANWPAPLFPTLALFAAVGVSQAKTAGAWLKRIGCAGVLIGLAVSVVVQVHAVSPLTGALKRKDPTFQLRGWQDVGAELGAIAEKEGAGFLATTGYGLNGQLAFLFDSRLPVIQLNERIRYVMLPTVSGAVFNGPGLYVSERRRDRSDHLMDRFAKVQEIATIARKVEGHFLEDLVVYRIEPPAKKPVDPVFPLPLR